MDVAATKNDLDIALTGSGYRYRLAPVSLVDRLEETLEGLVREGLLAQALYQEYAESLRFSFPPEVAGASTLIVLAYPSHAVRVRFHLASGPLEAVVPPTYISSGGRERCLDILRSVLMPSGHTVARVRAPLKLLAVRSGLAQYGRNNIAYVKNLGSMVRLDAFGTDADLEAEEFENRGSDLMSCCPPCRNCHHHCPVECIPHAGTVIDASRCLTYVNEHEGEWPGWLDPQAHNSLVGCMRCQEMCPANRYYLRRQKAVAEFDAEETDIILLNLAPDEIPAGVRAKLAKLDLVEYSTVLGRNLLALSEVRPVPDQP